jgi:hypothetical protein
MMCLGLVVSLALCSNAVAVVNHKPSPLSPLMEHIVAKQQLTL